MTAAQARDIVATSHRLMDTMLSVEDQAFRELDAGLQRTADATRERIMAAWRTGGAARIKQAELLPDDQWLSQLLLPPIADLVALARERAVAVADQQMRQLVGVVGPHAQVAAESGARAARKAAPDIERVVYAGAVDTVTASVLFVRGLVAEQRRMWAARHEQLPALVARLCSAERVGLPGASKGAVWAMQTRLHAVARAASVDTCNALLIASMRGWNDRADDESAA